MAADTHVWTGATNGNWGTAGNWDTGAVPESGDTVVLENNAVSINAGLDQNAVTLAALTIKSSYTGQIGLARSSAPNDYLKISATTINIGQGEGNGSGRIKINTGTVQTALNLYVSGTRAETGIPAMLWKGTHVANTATVNRGDLGAAFYAGETAAIATLNVGYINSVASDSSVVCGSGTTLTTINKIGGSLTIQSNSVTITQSAGELSIAGTGTVTTLNIDGGTGYYESSGTCTTANVTGTLDFRRDMRARTVTQLNVYRGASVSDPGATVALTNGIDAIRCGLRDVSLDFGEHRTWTPSAI